MEMIVRAAVLGLSTGMYCAGFCLPVMFPIVMMQERATFLDRTKSIIKFSLGRLAAYLLIGGLCGYVGQTVHPPFLRPITAASFMVLSLLLIGYGLMSGFPHFKICLLMKKALPETRFTWLSGFFMGLNICPPFLLAITDVVQTGHIGRGVLFFFIFYLTTSCYLLPFIFIGYFARQDAFRWVARMTTVLAGCLFFWLGLSHILLL
jgi:sulfite exporter TauE/SafE